MSKRLDKDRYTHNREIVVDFFKSPLMDGMVFSSRRWGQFGPKESVNKIISKILNKRDEVISRSHPSNIQTYLENAAESLREFALYERRRTMAFDAKVIFGESPLMLIFSIASKTMYPFLGLVFPIVHEVMATVRYRRLRNVAKELDRQADAILEKEKGLT